MSDTKVVAPTPQGKEAQCAEANTPQGTKTRPSMLTIHWFMLSLILAIPSVVFLGFAAGQQMELTNVSPLWAFAVLDLGLLCLALTGRYYSVRIWLRLTSLFCITLVVAFFLDVIVHVFRDDVGGYVVAWWLIHFG